MKTCGGVEYCSTILYLGTKSKRALNFTPQEKSRGYPLYTYMRLGGPQSRPGHCGVEKISCPCQESNPDRSARNLVAIPIKVERVKNCGNISGTSIYGSEPAWSLSMHYIRRSGTWLSKTSRKQHSCKIWGFHGGDYEECRLLGCGSV
jgi:hypothetical protein